MSTLDINAADVKQGSLVLVNESLPFESEPDTQSLKPIGGVLLVRQAANMLKAALANAGAEESILAVSGFRTMGEQKSIYTSSLRSNGIGFTNKYVALPGCSEHQTGLAVDLAENKEGIDFIRPDFPCSGVCGRFRKSAAEYGFIERYPKGCEHITHIAHEPWHFRYVGYPHSVIMEARGDTLEEYTEYLKRFRYGGEHLNLECGGRRFEIFFAPQGACGIELPEGVPYQLSGNNDDGAVVTLWGCE